MPHFVLGIWKGRMFSGFGFGNTQNILYGLLNFAISISLYIYNYGFEHLLNNGMYFGSLTTLLIFFFTGQFWCQLFSKAEAKSVKQE